MTKWVRNISFLVIALLLVFCLTLGLAACGDSETTDGTPGQDPEGEETEDEELEGMIFEAEYTDVQSLIYAGVIFKGPVTTDFSPVVPAEDASNGYCIGNMYNAGTYIQFEITSTADVEIELYMSVAMEYDCYAGDGSNRVNMSDEDFAVMVNTDNPSQRQLYGDVSFSVKNLRESHTHRAFQEIYLGTASFREGKNTVKMLVYNNIQVVGRISSIAPLVDYLRIVPDSASTATLSWSPVETNIDGTTLSTGIGIASALVG